ncbi:MAG: phenylalanine--tRNA ligase subunit alpha [Candidatus Diapherotrites archaeon]|nr:phenylalanine--tRNA ligase subunit alpha [Candidatus Diapherotrites archaeon]
MQELKAKVLALSEIERKLLKNLSNEFEGLEKLAKKSNEKIDAIRRASAWLISKGFAEERTEKREVIKLTEKGKEAKEKSLPERRLLNAIIEMGEASIDELKKAAKLSNEEFNIALGINKKKAFIVIRKSEKGTVISLTDVAKEFGNKQFSAEKGIELVVNGKEPAKEILDELIQRSLVERKTEERILVRINENGRKALEILKKIKGKRHYNIFDPAPRLIIGKRQPYARFLDKIREKLVALGFEEMETKLIELEFYNFDVLFQPQNHPARSWSDTYSLKFPKYGKLPKRSIVKAIKDAHEFGGKTGSKGWRYKWSERIAMRLMPAAHGTAASARQLCKGVKIPGKYFALARCYRPDIMDATHLIEFNQLEGIVIDKSFTFRHLLGMLKQFAIEIANATEVRFYPDYYPFTEPSVQLSAKHPKLGWFEFGGAGIFRPEFVEQLGIKAKVLAWGLGIDRLAMCALGIKDIRQLFSSNLEWLRKTPLVEFDN